MSALQSVELSTLEAPPGFRISVAELLLRAELVDSKNEGRRLIRNGGVRLNDVKVNNCFSS